MRGGTFPTGRTLFGGQRPLPLSPDRPLPVSGSPGISGISAKAVGRSEGTEPRPSQETPVLTERFQENLWQVRICYQFVRNTPIGGYPRFSFLFRVRMNNLGILLKCRFCGSVGLDRGPGRCISNELPGDVKAAGPWGTRGAGPRRRMRGRFAWRDRGALCRRRRWPRSSRVSGRRGTERTASERRDPHRFRGAVGGKPRWKAAGPNPSSQTGNGAPTGRGLAPPHGVVSHGVRLADG